MRRPDIQVFNPTFQEWRTPTGNNCTYIASTWAMGAPVFRYFTKTIRDLMFAGF